MNKREPDSGMTARPVVSSSTRGFVFALCIATASFLALGCAESENESFDPRDRYGDDIADFSEGRTDSLPFYKGEDFQPFWADDPQIVERDARTVADFQLTDQTGAAFTGDALAGKIYVANFFFTRCNGICPRAMPNLKRVQAAYGGNPSVMIVSCSITPEEDDPSTLATYAEGLQIQSHTWKLLTGPTSTIYQLARESFGADTKTLNFTEDLDFVHSEHAYLVDQQGRLRGIYNANNRNEIDRLISEVPLLMH